MVIAAIGFNLAISIGAWVLIWQLFKLRRQAAAIEVMTIELTWRCDRELPDLQQNLVRYRRQIRAALATYEVQVATISGWRQLIYALGWWQSMRNWQKSRLIKKAIKRKKI